MAELNEEIKTKQIINFVIAFFSLIIITTVSIIINKNQKKAIDFITNKYFIISFIIIVIFCYYIMFIIHENDESSDEIEIKKSRLKIATKHALIAYVITIFTSIDSIILAPFLLIWIMSYFLHIE